jgi:lysophospholipase L1-like esterase
MFKTKAVFGVMVWALSMPYTVLSASAQQNASSANAHWVATWASSQQQPRGGFARPPAPPAAATGTAPGGTPPAATSPVPPLASGPTVPPTPPQPRPARSFNNQTLRMTVKASIGGSHVRVHLSNAYGTTPLLIGDAHIALHGTGSAIVPGSDRALTFNGKPSVSIPIGAEMLSDAVALDVPALGDMSVSVFIPGDSGPASTHSLGLHTTWISKEGDFTGAPEIADPEKTQAWYWVSSVDVDAPADAATIVAFGDSITDGATSTPDTDRSWPSFLAQRLVADPAHAHIAVVNQGISGNMILRDGAGVSALARFDRDVLAQPGVKWLMILEGINDMNGAGRPAPGTQPITSDDLIGAMKQMIARAHDHGIKVIGCTLTPFGNANDTVEGMRQAMNAFIRTSGMFDAVVDFEKATQDPANPRQFHAGYNNTDRLHPNDAGYKAMADAVDLSLFSDAPVATKKRK